MVLDAELVAIDRNKSNELKSFQELSTRARGAVAASEVGSSICWSVSFQKYGSLFLWVKRNSTHKYGIG